MMKIVDDAGWDMFEYIENTWQLLGLNESLPAGVRV